MIALFWCAECNDYVERWIEKNSDGSIHFYRCKECNHRLLNTDNDFTLCMEAWYTCLDMLGFYMMSMKASLRYLLGVMVWGGVLLLLGAVDLLSI